MPPNAPNRPQTSALRKRFRNKALDHKARLRKTLRKGTFAVWETAALSARPTGAPCQLLSAKKHSLQRRAGPDPP